MDQPTFTIEQVVTTLKKSNTFLTILGATGTAQLNWGALTPKAIEKANQPNDPRQNNLFSIMCPDCKEPYEEMKTKDKTILVCRFCQNGKEKS